jgi:uncharacterized protein involved in exopolysaccharide biosynthesis
MRIGLPWRRPAKVAESDDATTPENLTNAAATGAAAIQAASAAAAKMRGLFWRGKTSARDPATPARAAATNDDDFDLRAIGQMLARKKFWILVPTIMVAAAALFAVNIMTPRYKSEARIIIDGRENIFLRPNAERTEDRAALDQEAVTSQVQLILSRDLARGIIARNGLAELPEFDSLLGGVSRLKSVLIAVGIGRDPMRLTREERVFEAYYERLLAYAVDKSRVIAVEFQSSDPELAARVANSIAEGYLVLQQGAKQEQAKSASQWLSTEIDILRKKVADAETRAEEFRSKSDLFVGTNNTSLSNQQLGEINTQLNAARAAKSDAESKARMIRDMLQSGRPIEASAISNSDIIRRLSEQRAAAKSRLAEQSSTLLDGHPRIKELRAQIADIDRQMREEVARVVRSLENDARIEGARVESLTANLDRFKRQASSTNSNDVEMRALEREAKAQRELLETYLARYREATTRETISSVPADARIISRAIVSNSPAFPKKLPIVVIATMLTFLSISGFFISRELLRMTASPRARAEPGEAVADSHPGLAATIGDIDALAAELRRGSIEGCRITVVGSARRTETTLTAITLARRLARDASVVLVGLTDSAQTLAAISDDPAAPGLGELDRGAATFGRVITRDRLSDLHLVHAGIGADRARLLQSPRLLTALDALTRVYEHLVIDAGEIADLPLSLVTSDVHAVLVADPGFSEEARAEFDEQLMAAGFGAVTFLTAGAASADGAPKPRMAAA